MSSHLPARFTIAKPASLQAARPQQPATPKHSHHASALPSGDATSKSIPSEKSIIRTVAWKDLLPMSRWESIHEVTLSLPWLLGSFAAYHYRIWPLGLLCSFMFFLTALRQVHNAYHYAIGFNRTFTEWFMVIMSPLMFCPLHAVQLNHLRHHKYNMNHEDVEAISARMPWWKAIITGPLFPWRLLKKALEVGNTHYRRWIMFEIVVCLAWFIVVLFVLDIFFLKAHLLVMCLGECLTSFFAVWLVHHDCDETMHSRTIRNRFKSFITYNMLYHYEHHLFPALSTCKLAAVAKRLDQAYPNLPLKQVF